MSLSKTLLAAAVGASALALTVANASAAVVCSGNVCWHTHEAYEYPPAAGVIVHEDGWAAGPSITWREHEGRGYWRDDRWNSW
jgi:hypothetical protein